jgi:hypothetical protein
LCSWICHETPHTTQADIARAIRAVGQTGARMEIEIAKDGTIRIIPSDSRRNFGEHINRLLESEREIVL